MVVRKTKHLGGAKITRLEPMLVIHPKLRRRHTQDRNRNRAAIRDRIPTQIGIKGRGCGLRMERSLPTRISQIHKLPRLASIPVRHEARSKIAPLNHLVIVIGHCTGCPPAPISRPFRVMLPEQWDLQDMIFIQRRQKLPRDLIVPQGRISIFPRHNALPHECVQSIHLCALPQCTRSIPCFKHLNGSSKSGPTLRQGPPSRHSPPVSGYFENAYV